MDGEHRGTQWGVCRRRPADGQSRPFSRRVGAAGLYAGSNGLRRTAAGQSARGVHRCRQRRVPRVPRRGLPTVAKIQTCRGLEVVEGARRPVRPGLPALPHDRLRHAARVRLPAARRRADGRRVRELPRPFQGPRRQFRDPHRSFRTGQEPLPTAATTARTARSSPTRSIGSRSITGRRRAQRI